ncbi:hypothetical protein GS498_14260 [Rhodococcus hoagii]|nr:hypothetical protein [Prescottella equi]
MSKINRKLPIALCAVAASAGIALAVAPAAVGNDRIDHDRLLDLLPGHVERPRVVSESGPAVLGDG